MRGSDVVLYAKAGPIAEITLNRPEVHNAISPEMACRLLAIVEDFARDEDLRVAIVTGAGDRTFCAGGDLGRTLPLVTGARAPEDEWDRRVVADPSILSRATLRGIDLDKPVIAAVNGASLAGGTELLLSTDIRVCSEGATFGLPEVRHGLVPFAGALVRLAQQVSYCNAMAMLLTGEALPADAALRIGLVNEVVAPNEVLPRARAIASAIARNGPLAVRQIKRAALHSVGLTLEEAYALEDAAMRTVMAGQDAREGPAAFIEKRAPVFTGR